MTTIMKGLILVAMVMAATCNVEADDQKLTNNFEQLDDELVSIALEFEQKNVETFYDMIRTANMMGEAGKDTERPIKGPKTEIQLVLYSMAATQLKYAISNYVANRRMLTGLKVNLARQTRDQDPKYLRSLLLDSRLPVVASSKVNLKQNFPQITDEELSKMAYMIEFMAKYRVMDDVMIMRLDDFKRIHQLSDKYATSDESPYSDLVAYWSLRILTDYYKNILGYEELLRETVINLTQQINYSFSDKSDTEDGEQHDGAILAKVNTIINDALDIQLSKEAQQLEVPLTITQSMIDNLTLVWLPKELIGDYKQVLEVLKEANFEPRPLTLRAIDIGLESTMKLIERVEQVANRHPEE